MVKKLLRREFIYKRKFINACILRIRFGERSERTVKGYKTFIFKSMKTIVEKNICNYINLLNGSPCRQIPEYDEILSECWIVFEDCINKYKVTKYNNFYFYFNKALSRRFYKYYCREINYHNTDMTEEIELFHPKLSHNPHLDTEEVLFHTLHLTKFEQRVCRSKLKGERISEFLKRNKSCTPAKYHKAMTNIKLILKQAIKENKW